MDYKKHMLMIAQHFRDRAYGKERIYVYHDCHENPCPNRKIPWELCQNMEEEVSQYVKKIHKELFGTENLDEYIAKLSGS